MRQQYHSRIVGKDRLIWDVNKLVQHAKSLLVRDIPLDAIQEIDEEYWYEAAGSPAPTCQNVADHAKLIYECSLDYPVILCAEGRVMDGMHRCCKAYLEGYKTIKAVKFEKTPPPDYMNKSLKDLPYEH